MFHYLFIFCPHVYLLVLLHRKLECLSLPLVVLRKREKKKLLYFFPSSATFPFVAFQIFNFFFPLFIFFNHILSCIFSPLSVGVGFLQKKNFIFFFLQQTFLIYFHWEQEERKIKTSECRKAKPGKKLERHGGREPRWNLISSTIFLQIGREKETTREIENFVNANQTM